MGRHAQREAPPSPRHPLQSEAASPSAGDAPKIDLRGPLDGEDASPPRAPSIANTDFTPNASDFNDEPPVRSGKKSPRNKINTTSGLGGAASMIHENSFTDLHCPPTFGSAHVLHVDVGRPAPAGADRELHAALLQQLLGQQLMQDIRELIREELERVLAPEEIERTPRRLSTKASVHSTNTITLEKRTTSLAHKESYGDGAEVPMNRIASEDLELDAMGAYPDPLTLAELIAHASENWMPCVGRVAHRVHRVLSQLGVHNAPPRTDLVSRFVESNVFTLVIYLAIVANLVFMIYSADLQISNYTSNDQEGAEFVRITEAAFLLVYATEFALKLWRYRLHFFIDTNWKWNWLDVTLLSLSFYFVVLEGVLPNVSFLRMLRILKLAKVLRVFRLVAMFKTLRAILKSLISTVGTLAWSIIMICVLLLVFGLIFTLVTGNYLNSLDSPGSTDGIEPLVDAFGSVWASSLTLFMCVTGGNDWGAFYEILVPMGPATIVFFLYFIFFIQIAVLNIILGLFVDQAMKSMVPTSDEAAVEHAMEERQAERDLREILQRADIVGDGKISAEEWRATLRTGHVSSFVDLMGFKASDLLEYYKIMHRQAPDGKVDLDRFMAGCLKMKGPASRFDVRLLHCEVQTVIADLARVTEQVAMLADDKSF